MNDSDARYTGQVSNCIRHGEGTYKYPYGGGKLFKYNGGWNQV